MVAYTVMSVMRITLFLMIIRLSSAQSYNQPKFSLCASWDRNATIFANESWIGQRSSVLFINNKNNVYVTDGENNRIVVWYNEPSVSLKTILENLINPWGIFVTIDDAIYVDNGFINKRVDKWTLNTPSNMSVMNINGSCAGLFVDINNNLYCSLMGHHCVVRIDLNSTSTDSTLVAGTRCPGPVVNMLDHPHGIFVDTNLDLYVADTHNNRIQRFAFGEMNAITMAGFGARTAFLLNRPTSIVLDGDGYLFIVDSQNHRIVRSTSSGFECLIACSGETGGELSQLNNPHSMAFDSNGHIFVTDLNNRRIQKFALTTNPCATAPSTTSTTAGCHLCSGSNYADTCNSCSDTSDGCLVTCYCRPLWGSEINTSITLSPGTGNGCQLQNNNGYLNCSTFCA